MDNYNKNNGENVTGSFNGYDSSGGSGERRRKITKDKVLLFIIGFLAGAVVATGAFFIYVKVAGVGISSGEQSAQMPGGGTPPEMPNGENGAPPEMPSGEGGESGTPPEMPSGESGQSGQDGAPPEMPSDSSSGQSRGGSSTNRPGNNKSSNS